MVSDCGSLTDEGRFQPLTFLQDAVQQSQFVHGSFLSRLLGEDRVHFVAQWLDYFGVLKDLEHGLCEEIGSGVDSSYGKGDLLDCGIIFGAIRLLFKPFYCVVVLYGFFALLEPRSLFSLSLLDDWPDNIICCFDMGSDLSTTW